MEVDRNGNGIRNRGIKRKETFSPDRNSKAGELVIAGLDEDADPDEDLDREMGDEDEEEDDENPGRGETSTNCDIERLKAFNVIQFESPFPHSFIIPFFRCLFDFSSMKTWIGWFQFLVNPKKKFRPLSKVVTDSFLILWNALGNGSEHI